MSMSRNFGYKKFDSPWPLRKTRTKTLIDKKYYLLQNINLKLITELSPEKKPLC